MERQGQGGQDQDHEEGLGGNRPGWTEPIGQQDTEKVPRDGGLSVDEKHFSDRRPNNVGHVLQPRCDVGENDESPDGSEKGQG